MFFAIVSHLMSSAHLAGSSLGVTQCLRGWILSSESNFIFPSWLGACISPSTCTPCACLEWCSPWALCGPTWAAFKHHMYLKQDDLKIDTFARQSHFSRAQVEWHVGIVGVEVFCISSVSEEAGKSTPHMLTLSEELWSSSISCKTGNSINDYFNVV